MLINEKFISSIKGKQLNKEMLNLEILKNVNGSLILNMTVVNIIL